ncbi:MAG: hypothetical protein LBP63_08755 [Prevotellaceae bacterium]|jgi:hypothetical protein|nr:hypothetical protein [Prevotellaceae bacterium]
MDIKNKIEDDSLEVVEITDDKGNHVWMPKEMMEHFKEEEEKLIEKQLLPTEEELEEYERYKEKRIELEKENKLKEHLKRIRELGEEALDICKQSLTDRHMEINKTLEEKGITTSDEIAEWYLQSEKINEDTVLETEDVKRAFIAGQAFSRLKILDLLNECEEINRIIKAGHEHIKTIDESARLPFMEGIEFAIDKLTEIIKCKDLQYYTRKYKS